LKSSARVGRADIDSSDAEGRAEDALHESFTGRARIVNAVAAAENEAAGLRQNLPTETEARAPGILAFGADGEGIAELGDAGRNGALEIGGDDIALDRAGGGRIGIGEGLVEIGIAAAGVAVEADVLEAEADVDVEARGKFDVVLEISIALPGVEIAIEIAKSVERSKDIADCGAILSGAFTQKEIGPALELQSASGEAVG